MKKRAEINPREILVIGIISLIIVSVSVSLISATTMDSPVSGGNYSTSLNITITVDANGVNNMTNVTCYYNGSGGTATTFLTEIINITSPQTVFTNGSINTTSINNQTYNVSCIVQNGTTLNTTISKVIKIDNTAPTNLDFGTDIAADYANFSRSHIYINITNATEINEKNITFNIYYTNGSIANSTFYTNKARLINVTNLTDGKYKYNVTVCDYSNNCNSTGTRNIALDNLAPILSLSSSATKTSLTLTVSAPTDTTGLNGTCTVDGSATISGFTINKSGLTCEHSYPYNVTCYDYVGLLGNRTESFSTSDCEDDSSDSSGGSNDPVNYTVTSVLLSKNYTKVLFKNDGLKMNISGEWHYLILKTITNTSIKIKLFSNPQEATISAGNESKFDLTGDGYYDLIVRLNSVIASSRASITVRSVYEKIPAEILAANASNTNNTNGNTENTEDKKYSNWYWILAIIVIILIAGGIWYFISSKE